MYFHSTLTNHLPKYPLFEEDNEDVLDVLFFLLLFAFAMGISFNAAFTLSLAEPSTENNAAPPEITALIHSSDRIAVTVVIQVLVIQCRFAHAQH